MWEQQCILDFNDAFSLFSKAYNISRARFNANFAYQEAPANCRDFKRINFKKLFFFSFIIEVSTSCHWILKLGDNSFLILFNKTVKYRKPLNNWTRIVFLNSTTVQQAF